jgi:hypothetical protein
MACRGASAAPRCTISTKSTAYRIALQKQKQTTNVRTRSTTKNTRRTCEVVIESLDVPRRTLGVIPVLRKFFLARGFSRDLHYGMQEQTGLCRFCSLLDEVLVISFPTD